MSSALIQINSDGGFFRPGVLRCDVVSPVAHRHQHRSAHYCHALSEQLLPYMTGEPWKFARAEMTKWQGSHMEADVRRAAAQVHLPQALLRMLVDCLHLHSQSLRSWLS